MDETEPMAYIGRKPCGCLVAAYMEDPPKEMLAENIAGLIADGYTVEHVTAQAVRDEGWGCKCEPELPLTEEDRREEAG